MRLRPDVRIQAALAGACLTLSLPPLPLWPLALIAAGWLFRLLQAAPDARAAFRLGWIAGFFQFGLMLYWLTASLFVDIGRYFWAVPLVALAAPAALALFTALPAWGFRRLLPRWSRWALAPGFALAMTGSELLRSHLLTGFPWGLTGYASLGLLPLAQAGAVIGVLGLSLILWLSGALLLQPGPWARPARSLALPLLAVPIAFGLWRLEQHPTRYASDSPRLQLVQPNIAQELKFAEGAARDNFRSLLRLSAPADPAAPPDAVIWPESALPFLLEGATGDQARAAIAAVLPDQTWLLTGLVRREPSPDGLIWQNALSAMDGAMAQDRVLYAKAHLVPFGEYMPLGRWLGLPSIAAGSVSFSPGPGPRTLALPAPLGRFSPSICYEIIFPGQVADRADRPDWLLTVTNDGWFGRTAGPHQHFHMARMRAIEEGLPLVRAANTGISGVIDPLGRIISRSRLDEVTVLSVRLPEGLDTAPVVARAGGGIELTLLIAVLIFGTAPLWAGRRGRKPALN